MKTTPQSDWPTTNATTADDICQAVTSLSNTSVFGASFNAQSLLMQMAIAADFIGMAFAEYDVPDWGIDWDEAAHVYADRIGRGNAQSYGACQLVNMRRALAIRKGESNG